MSSSDQNTVDTRWASHYAEASQRRRDRGWHRREHGPGGREQLRRRVALIAAAIFIVAVAVALALPK